MRQLCVELSHLKLHQIKRGTVYTLDEFLAVQEEHKAQLVSLAGEHSKERQQLVRQKEEACRAERTQSVAQVDAAHKLAKRVEEEAQMKLMHETVMEGMRDKTRAIEANLRKRITIQEHNIKASFEKIKQNALLNIRQPLEGPEFGVYIRGKIDNDNKIALPDYWEWLVDEDSISVHITPIGYHILPLYFKEIKDNYVYVNKKTNFYYYICAERKDIEKLKIIEKK